MLAYELRQLLLIVNSQRADFQISDLQVVDRSAAEPHLPNLEGTQSPQFRAPARLKQVHRRRERQRSLSQ
jgi:hypothetical protein